MPLPECYPLFMNYVEERLPAQLRHFPMDPPLIESMEYSLMAGGKRIRPVLVLAVFSSLTSRLTSCTRPSLDDLDLVKPSPLYAGIALEYIHTYSLIHDDLPAMDNDDFRRGRPTLHKVKGEDMAVLAGDALLTTAFLLLSKHYSAHPALSTALTEQLSTAALKMVEGQVMDTLPAEDKPRSLDYLERLVDYKTGALLTAALTMGGSLAGGDARLLTLLDELGQELGRLFQITDDLLDVTGTKENLGKTPGKDQAQDKLTFVTFLGVEGAKTKAQETLDRALHLLEQIDMDPHFFRDLLTFVHERTY